MSKTVGAAVDTVTLSGVTGKNFVYNRGATIIWFRAGRGTVDDPTAAGDECFPVLPMTKEPLGGGPGQVVKILGPGDYTVIRGG